MELSTNEWKRKKVDPDQCFTQQTKNIRSNKAIRNIYIYSTISYMMSLRSVVYTDDEDKKVHDS